jgi:hypothetical protein
MKEFWAGAGAAAVLAFVFFLVWKRSMRKRKPEYSVSEIHTRLEKASDLTTAKLLYTGLVSVDDGSIPFLTHKGFSMVYTARVWAGVDLSMASVHITQEAVTVHLPHVTIQGVSVDEKSLKFYDARRALFNWQEMSDVTAAITKAKNDLLGQEEVLAELKQSAQRQAVLVIQSLLAGNVGTREVHVEEQQ